MSRKSYTESISSNSSFECDEEMVIEDSSDSALDDDLWSSSQPSIESEASFIVWEKAQDLAPPPVKKFDFVPFEKQTTSCTLKSRNLIFDSHCHLDRIYKVVFNKRPKEFLMEKVKDPLGQFKLKFPQAFCRNFDGCIHVITDPKDFDYQRWKHLEDNPKIYLALGCHPSNADYFDDMSDFCLEKAMEHGKVVALGEIGLDDKWTNNHEKSFWQQQKVFSRQVALALKMEKPLVLHIRGPNSTRAAMQIMQTSKVPPEWPIHMHCFTDSWETCAQWLEIWPKMKFGFTSDSFLKEVVDNLNLDQILLETDAPYFRPKKIGSRPCSLPGDIWFVAQQIAYFKKVTVEEVLMANRRNVTEVYGIPWSPMSHRPLKLVKEVFAHACNQAIPIQNKEDADQIDCWIHTCNGSIRVARQK